MEETMSDEKTLIEFTDVHGEKCYIDPVIVTGIKLFKPQYSHVGHPATHIMIGEGSHRVQWGIFGTPEQVENTLRGNAQIIITGAEPTEG